MATAAFDVSYNIDSDAATPMMCLASGFPPTVSLEMSICGVLTRLNSGNGKELARNATICCWTSEPDHQPQGIGNATRLSPPLAGIQVASQNDIQSQGEDTAYSVGHGSGQQAYATSATP